MTLVYIERIFVYSTIWSIGANLDVQGKIMFDHLLRDIEGIFPFTLQVYDYFLDFDKFEFFPWENKLTVSPQHWKPPAS
jgi:uncharacterized membrane protein